MTYLIKNARVIDPANKLDKPLDILIVDGKIDRIEAGIDIKSDEVIDAKGKIVAQGFIDMHAHLREPGREDEETIHSGTRSALRGGFTAVCCMPNTEPPLDNPEIIDAVRNIIKKDAATDVYIIGTITEGRLGKKLADFARMKKAGAIAVSDDGSTVEDVTIMSEAVKSCKAQNILLIDHCENSKTSSGGVVNKGFVSTKTGLRGIPRESEYEVVKRDVELAKINGAKIHIAHVSCKESVDIIRKAKKSGVEVTAETAPHYFTLTEECCVTYDTCTKMNPPLRTKEDVEAIKEGLSDGTIDCIATDHAPHTDSEKGVEFDFAPFGIIGFETALSLSVMELVDTKVLSWSELASKLSVNPAKILGLEKPGIKKGAAADLVIIDPEKEYIYTKDSIESKSKNSPFVNWKLKAKVSHVFVSGKIRMNNGVI